MYCIIYLSNKKNGGFYINMKLCEVVFTNDTINDLKILPNNVRKECFEKLGELEKNIHLGKALKNLDGINLQGYHSLYFHEAKYRIVYKKINSSIEIITIKETEKPKAELVAIGKRNNKEVYKEAFKRILTKKYK